jgi:hypothetical protein
MNRPPRELEEAKRWQREANEELRAADVIVDHDDVPDRIAGLEPVLAAGRRVVDTVNRLGTPHESVSPPSPRQPEG